MDQLSLASARQIQITHEHVAGIDASALVLAVTSVAVTVVAPVLLAIAGVVFHRVVAVTRPGLTLRDFTQLARRVMWLAVVAPWASFDG